jgi:Ser/Thr protein kinase RdoA (MazF antagonist)
MTFIPDTVIHQQVTEPQLARETGKVIGEFQARLADMEEPLVKTIDRFHDISFRLIQFDESLEKAGDDRKEGTDREQLLVAQRRKAMQNYFKALQGVKIPVRITHNDTKVNNILFDRDGNGLCLIDLDTVMPGYIHYDFGDALRTLASTAAEDEPDPEKIHFNPDLYEAFSNGYIRQISRIMTCEEMELLPFAPLYMTYMQAVRFLTDHLNGDVYFRVEYPGHNLVRARAQFKLLTSMESQMREMEKIFQEILKMNTNTPDYQE